MCERREGSESNVFLVSKLTAVDSSAGSMTHDDDNDDDDCDDDDGNFKGITTMN